ncbi:MAG: glycosyltransferase family 2 protein [Anaerolineales bacterium]|jgi:GT2 family glycosyltransferase|nr:glycosyltransferase family 2 protein [Anaerolineales bacterium]
MNAPYFSILILCWNSQPYLRRCLQSLQAQTFKDFDIWLADNGSEVRVDWTLLQEFPGLQIHTQRWEQNLGFARGNNSLASLAQGQYLVLLNTDAFPQPDWLEVVHQAAARYPDCSFASRLLLANAPQRLDGVGDNYHASGIVWRRLHGQPAERAATQEQEVFSACGAAAVYPRQAYSALGGLDEEFFAYLEDVDLGFRLRLAGVRCIYLPAAVVQHVGSGSTSRRSDFSVYYGNRNMVWTFFKDMPLLLLVILLPGHVLMNLGMVLLSGFRRQGRLTWRAKLDALAGLRRILRQRPTVQAARKTSLLGLARVMDWNPVSPFTKLWIK